MTGIQEPAEVECTVVDVLDDGSVVISVQGRRERVRLHGLDVPVPVPPGYVEILTQRLARVARPLRVETTAPGPPPRVILWYLAWQDKSGPVWDDVATALLAEGAARVALPHDREDYLRAEADARTRGVGIWSDRS
ncbi:MAG TPA: hypothetical protein VKB69_08310 [Micromonosporaceae bacterium]|nr:hypothetical protein [Micromonosporaceae bacterium]